MKKKSRTPSSRRPRREARESEPLEVGTKLLDPVDKRSAIVLDVACQYSHPKAPPMFTYLLRWEDGQVQAITEAALRGERGIHPVD